MVISNIIANNKNATTLDAHVIQTITVDNQEYNFADESDEVVSTVPTDIVLEDAVPEPIINLGIKGNSEQKQYEGYNLFNADLIEYGKTREGRINYNITYQDGILTSPDGAYGDAYYLYGPSMHLTPNYYRIRAEVKFSNANGNVNQILGRMFNLTTNSWLGGAVPIYPSSLIENEWNQVEFRSYSLLKVTEEADYTIGLQPGGTSAGYSNLDCQFRNIMVVPNDSGDEEYEPYVGGIPSPNPEYPQPVNSTSDSEVDISIHSRNLLDLTTFEDRAGITSTLIPNGISMTYSGTSDYISIATTIGDEPDFYDTYLTLSGNYTISGNYGEVILTGFEIFYYASGNPGITILGNISKYGSGKFSMVSTRRVPKYVPGAQLVINLYFRNRTGTTTDAVIEWTDIMLERGSTATDYQPYFRDTVEVPVSSGIVLRGLGGYYDELIAENGTVKHIQRVHELLLHPERDWYLNAFLDSVGVKVYQHLIDDRVINGMQYSKDYQTAISENFRYIKASSSILDDPTYNNTICPAAITTIAFKTDGRQSLEDFVSWYNTTNPKSFILLETPIETDITNTTVGQQLLQLSTERGLNTMHIIADVEPSEIKTKYWKQIR